MLTRRQKNTLRGSAAVLSCCALLSVFLIYTNISNTAVTEPVVFSDILEGAVAYGDEEDETPAVTLASDELLETMFSEQYATFTLPDDPSLTVTYIPPEAVYNVDTNTGDTLTLPDVSVSSAETDTGDDTGGMPLNPNEITLLSDDIGSMTVTERTPETTVSARTTSRTVSSGTRRTSAETTPGTRSKGTEETPYFLTSDTPYADVTETSLTASQTTVRTTARTTAPTSSSTPPTTVRTETTSTAAAGTTTAKTAHTTSKTAFTNIGGGTFSNDDNVYLTMLRLVNNARRQAGLNELWYSARVHEVCITRAVELSSYYSHNRPDGTKFSTAFKEKGINYEKCGENIAYGRNMFRSAEEVFKAWMESDSHRENILSSDFDCCAFGLCILKVDNDTYYYWTQEFARF